MPDKKLNDSEIIKALEICAENDKCRLCPIRNKCKGFPDLHKKALDLINHLKAENERLKKFLDMSRKVSLARRDRNLKICELNQKILEELKTAKAEAYKEFAEKFKSKFRNGDEVSYAEWLIHYEADNLLKELVGDTDA